MKHIPLENLEQIMGNSNTKKEGEDNILEDFEETNNVNDTEMTMVKQERTSSSAPPNPNHPEILEILLDNN
ncbi:hypothetical protein HYC85_029125 [Camellia sinensis]|uniref:Uncharacterized protein n=1 Tax=Camellia sinensis TaxID=4442 RepID=A0A7J7G118_CAMSI|nr:hypothetical protein HYC85_029125 [Camellia sinensis]